MLDTTPIDGEGPKDVNRRLGERVRSLRSARGLSLDALAATSGVSRSMISLIERGESSPTAVVLERLSVGLGVTMAALFEPERCSAEPGPLMRRADQPEWTDPGSGYVRRNVSPPGADHPMQIVDVLFPAGARVSFETGTREVRVRQQVWVLAGRIDVVHGEDHHQLEVGDCLAMELDRATLFHNPTRKTARYAVVMAAESSSGAR